MRTGRSLNNCRFRAIIGLGLRLTTQSGTFQNVAAGKAKGIQGTFSLKARKALSRKVFHYFPKRFLGDRTDGPKPET